MLCRGTQSRAQRRRREGGTRDRGKGRRRSLERRRGGGTRGRGNGAKEVARTAGGKAAGARVIGG